MKASKEVEKARNEIFELANHLCPYKGEDEVYLSTRMNPSNAPMSVKRSSWISGFVKGALLAQEISLMCNEKPNIE